MYLEGELKMFNLIKDDFDESLEDIMNSVDKILNEENNKEEQIEKGK